MGSIITCWRRSIKIVKNISNNIEVATTLEYGVFEYLNHDSFPKVFEIIYMVCSETTQVMMTQRQSTLRWIYLAFCLKAHGCGHWLA